MRPLRRRAANSLRSRTPAAQTEGPHRSGGRGAGPPVFVRAEWPRGIRRTRGCILIPGNGGRCRSEPEYYRPPMSSCATPTYAMRSQRKFVIRARRLGAHGYRRADAGSQSGQATRCLLHRCDAFVFEWGLLRNILRANEWMRRGSYPAEAFPRTTRARRR